MNDLAKNVMPILILIFLGYILQKIKYFDESSIRKLQSMVVNITIPSMLFITFLNLNIEKEYIMIALSFSLYQGILLLVGWLIYKIFKIKRRFFPFFHCAFAFGVTAMPFYATVFGTENLKYISILGVGHELFIGLIFMTGAKIFLKNDKVSIKNTLKTLVSPLFIMITIAILIRIFNLKELLFSNFLGSGIYSSIERLGNMSLTLTLITIGYRLKLSNKENIKESIWLVVLRYILTFGIGYAFKFTVMDRLVAPNIFFDYAFFTLLSQHGSIVLTVFVGEYSSKEDHEIINNALVINTLVGIVMYMIFVLTL